MSFVLINDKYIMTVDSFNRVVQISEIVRAKTENYINLKNNWKVIYMKGFDWLNKNHPELLL